MDFLSFLRGGGGYGNYPTVPIMRPQITGAATPNLSNLAQFIAMIRPSRRPPDQFFGTNRLREPGNWFGTIYTDPRTGLASTSQPAV